MKFRGLVVSTLSVLMSLSLASCGNNNDSSEDTGLVPPTSVVSEYEYDDTDISTQPNKAVDTIRFHYHRTDDTDNDRAAYSGWGIWAWDLTNGGNGEFYKFDKADIYGVYVDVPATMINATTPLKEVGFLVALISKVNGGYTWYGKDPDNDRVCDASGEAPGGVKQVYTITKNAKVYDDATTPLKPYINYARVSNTSLKEVTVSIAYVGSPINIDNSKLKVIINGSEVSNYTVGSPTVNEKSATILFSLTFTSVLKLTDDVKVQYAFDSSWIDKVPLLVTSYYDSTEFINTYAYNGDDLGATFDNVNNPTKTTFKLWAPTSSEVKLNLFDTSDYKTEKNPVETLDMELQEKGVWAKTINRNLDGKYYTYTVTNSKGTNEVTDPYAKSAGVNGKRGMVINFARLNQEVPGWTEDTRPIVEGAADPIIYEIHVRDMTINPNSNVSENNRGKFLGLAEKDTKFTKDGVTVSTGLAHMKELGITHVQIQPFYDYNSVDETLDNKAMSESNYNWGYDPQNYNVLEGSYSTDPYDGNVRVKEAKQMIMALHQEGMNVNMDVVYNHTGSTDGSNFQLIVPNYYYRTKTGGDFYNGSGCGNEVASDRAMGRKFILDSIKFWTEEYHMSGYRFDLMGLEDNQTMIDVYKAATAIYPDAMVYGEPWTGGSSKLSGGTDPNKLSSQTTVQASLYQPYFVGQGNYVGAFNDVIRNAVRGDNGPGTGYVQGQSGNASNVLAGIEGKFTRSNTATDKQNLIEPRQVINYVSCHDNYTLFDQLVLTNSARKLNDMYSQAEAIILTSQGVAFMQEGEDFMRTKENQQYDQISYCGNSYNVGDFINNMDYELKIEKREMFKEFKRMINLRKSIKEFTMDTRAEINEHLVDLTNQSGVISYKINKLDNTSRDIRVIHSLDGANVALEGYEVIYTNREYITQESGIVLGKNHTVVLAK